MTSRTKKSNESAVALAKKEHAKLVRLIDKNHTVIRNDYVVGFYRYMAKIDAIENALLHKGILTKEDIAKEEIPILRWMQKDFKKEK